MSNHLLDFNALARAERYLEISDQNSVVGVISDLLALAEQKGLSFTECLEQAESLFNRRRPHDFSVISHHYYLQRVAEGKLNLESEIIKGLLPKLASSVRKESKLDASIGRMIYWFEHFAEPPLFRPVMTLHEDRGPGAALMTMMGRTRILSQLLLQQTPWNVVVVERRRSVYTAEQILVGSSIKELDKVIPQQMDLTAERAWDRKNVIDSRWGDRVSPHHHIKDDVEFWQDIFNQAQLSKT